MSSDIGSCVKRRKPCQCHAGLSKRKVTQLALRRRNSAAEMSGELGKVPDIKGVNPICPAFLRTGQVEQIVSPSTHNVVLPQLQGKLVVFSAGQSDNREILQDIVANEHGRLNGRNSRNLWKPGEDRICLEDAVRTKKAFRVPFMHISHQRQGAGMMLVVGNTGRYEHVGIEELSHFRRSFPAVAKILASRS